MTRPSSPEQDASTVRKATFAPLGDAALLVRFADTLSEPANRAAIALGKALEATRPVGVEEVAPGLVSVLLRLRPGTEFRQIEDELRLMMGTVSDGEAAITREVAVSFDGEDLSEVAAMLHLSEGAFVDSHNATALTVLATGFAPGVVYCGFHPSAMMVPRRDAVRPFVPPGTVLFAAGQTAIAATPIRTGWHVIGRTAFQNFDPANDPPTILAAGDTIRFTVAR
jgi:KipI family sensor histidine kinase inhibitor